MDEFAQSVSQYPIISIWSLSLHNTPWPGVPFIMKETYFIIERVEINTYTNIRTKR